MNNIFKVIFIVLYTYSSLQSMQPSNSSTSTNALDELISDHKKWIQVIDTRSQSDTKPGQWLKYHLIRDKLTTNLLNAVKQYVGQDAMEDDYLKELEIQIRSLREIIEESAVDQSVYLEADKCMSELEQLLISSEYTPERSEVEMYSKVDSAISSSSSSSSSHQLAKEKEKEEDSLDARSSERPSTSLGSSKEEVILKHIRDTASLMCSDSAITDQQGFNGFKIIKNQFSLLPQTDETTAEKVMSLIWKEALAVAPSKYANLKEMPFKFSLITAACIHHDAFKKWIKNQADRATEESSARAQESFETVAMLFRKNAKALTPAQQADERYANHTLEVYDGPEHLQGIARFGWKTLHRILDHFPHAAESKYARTAQGLLVYDDSHQDINDRESLCIDSNGQQDTIYRASINHKKLMGLEECCDRYLGNDSMTLKALICSIPHPEIPLKSTDLYTLQVSKNGADSWTRRFSLPGTSDSEVVIHSMSVVQENSLSFSPKKTLVVCYGKKQQSDQAWRSYISIDGEYTKNEMIPTPKGLIGRKLVPGTSTSIRFYDWMKDNN